LIRTAGTTGKRRSVTIPADAGKGDGVSERQNGTTGGDALAVRPWGNYGNVLEGRWTCDMCGADFVVGGVLVGALPDGVGPDDDLTGKIDRDAAVAWMCSDCLAAGPAVAAARARKAAEEMSRTADRLRHGADVKDAAADAVAAVPPDRWLAGGLPGAPSKRRSDKRAV